MVEVPRCVRVLGMLALTAFLVGLAYSATNSNNPEETAEDEENDQPQEQKAFTLEEIAQFDGTDPEKPIYVSVKGIVYDVSSATKFYGPDGPYGMFAGKDVTRAFALQSTDIEDTNSTKWDDLSTFDILNLREWIDRFEQKYPIVGWLVWPDGETRDRGVKL